MDGITIIAVAGTVACFSVPTYWTLSKIYYKLGEHEQKLVTHGKRLNSIENKLDTLNGTLKKGKRFK